MSAYGHVKGVGSDVGLTVVGLSVGRGVGREVVGRLVGESVGLVVGRLVGEVVGRLVGGYSQYAPSSPHGEIPFQLWDTMPLVCDPEEYTRNADTPLKPTGM